MQRLDDPVATASRSYTLNNLMLADFALKTLAAKNDRLPLLPVTARLGRGLRLVIDQIAAFRLAQDNSGKAPRSKVTLEDIKKSSKQLERFYEPTVLNSARALFARYYCPMHSDVVGAKGAICPKCGMTLDTQIGLAAGSLTLPAFIKGQVQTDAPLQVGVKAKGHLNLSGPQGEPITPDQLREVHTQKIHLLIIDGSLTDYHHEHPVPTNVAGRYDFSFTPEKPGSYRVWADVQPLITGKQEYAMTIIPAAASEEALGDTRDRLEGNVNGLHYEIQFQQPVRARETAMGILCVKEADGSGFNRLEPVMGAFAHLVGFHENHTDVLHIHPEASQSPAPTDRGGPELHFRLYATIPGFFRLFV
jgi:hypothetical protein